MMKQKQYIVSLGIYSKTLSATDVTDILETQPSITREKGTPVNRRVPNSLIRQESMWLLYSEVGDEEPFDVHIERFICFIEEKLKEFEQLIQHCSLEIACSFFTVSCQGGLTLDAALLKRLTVLPINIVIDLYPPDTE